MLVFVVTKNTLVLLRIAFGLAFRAGCAMAGAKVQILFLPFTARLKSCPDTKHKGGDTAKPPISQILGTTTEI
jgi:hypothetical protein